MNARRLQAVAVACLAGSIGSVVLFMACKHRPAIAKVAPFVVDPFDGVGSFAIQLAIGAAALAVFRTMRARPPGGSDRGHAQVVVRTCVVALDAILMMLIADLVAMARAPSMWSGTPIGRALAATLVALSIVTALSVGFLVRADRAANPLRRAWRPGWPIAVVAGCIAALVAYPAAWRNGLYGTLATAVTGMLLLFIGAAALSDALLPMHAGPQDDVPDVLSQLIGRTWLAPRRHPIRLVLFVAILGGMTLALIEAAGEGLPSEARRAALVLGVFVGIEACGIALGLTLFNERLQLVRRTPRADG